MNILNKLRLKFTTSSYPHLSTLKNYGYGVFGKFATNISYFLSKF